MVGSVNVRRMLPVVVGSAMLLFVSVGNNKPDGAAFVSPEPTVEKELEFSSPAVGSLNQHLSEKTAADKDGSCLGESASSAECLEFARNLVKEGDDLKQRGMLDDAIAAYEEVGRYLGKDESPYAQAEVLKALVGKSYALKQQGRLKKDNAVCREIDRRSGMAGFSFSEWNALEKEKR